MILLLFYRINNILLIRYSIWYKINVNVSKFYLAVSKSTSSFQRLNSLKFYLELNCVKQMIVIGD